MAIEHIVDVSRYRLPVFVGAPEVVKLVYHLCTRPRFGDGPKPVPGQERLPRRERRGGKGLPMVPLVRPPELDQILGAIAKRLATAKPRRVPFAYLRLDPTPAPNEPLDDTSQPALVQQDVIMIRQLLIAMATGLSGTDNAKGGRFRFRRFELVAWLMTQELHELSGKRGWDLRWKISAHGLSKRVTSWLRELDDTAPARPAVVRWPLWLVLHFVLPAVFAVSVSGRVPWLSGEYRWCLRQPYLAPEEPGGFVGFAEKLTKEEWGKQDQNQVAKLLTNAFLEDLRREYRWRLFRRRRMAYPVVLLDNITRINGGYTLLKLINDVRNEIVRFDPLLVISGSQKVPPDARPPLQVDGPIAQHEEAEGDKESERRVYYEAEFAMHGLREWRDGLLQARRARRHTTWYLPLLTKEPAAAASPHATHIAPLRVPKPPWQSSPVLPVVLILLSLAGGMWGYTTWSHAHCGGWTDWPGFTPMLNKVDDSCVGLTPGDFGIFQPSSPLTDQVLARILAQNRQAEELHRAGSPRPFITLALLDTFTSSSDKADGLTGQRESLEGVAVAQSLQLKKSGDSEPLVRVIVANAGRGMRQGSRVARQLGAMAARDPSLIGVVGLNLSSQPTIDTIRALTEVGLPMVASTLSADNLADEHPMLYLVSPQNKREAAVAAAFGSHLLTLPRYAAVDRTVRVYYSDDAADAYSTNLRDDVVASFRAAGFTAQAVAFTPNDPGSTETAHTKNRDPLVGVANAAGRDTCGYRGLVYYAGRGVPDFGSFLDGVANHCKRPPTLIAGDDVTRHIADATARRSNQAVAYWAETFAVAPVSDQLRPYERNFYHELDTLFPFEEGEDGRSLDGHAALAYDAALTMITAVKYLRETESIPVTPGTVWRELNDIHTSRSSKMGGNKAVQGATGTIDFGGDVNRHVPLNKPVAILHVSQGRVAPRLAAFCGAPGDPRQSPFCPPPEN